MSTTLKSICKAALTTIWRCIKLWPPAAQTRGGAWASVVLARLKEFGPYAMMELLLPGGSVLALTLWLYRRRKKVPGFGQISQRASISWRPPWVAKGGLGECVEQRPQRP